MVRLRRGRRLGLLGVTLATVALAGPAPALAASGFDVTVNGRAAPVPFLPLSKILADVDVSPNPIARWRPTFDDLGPGTVPTPGTSAKELTRLAGIDPETLNEASAMVVRNPGAATGAGSGTVSTLSKQQILTGFSNPLDADLPNAFANFGNLGETADNQPRFDRPMTGAHEPSDFIFPGDGLTISVALSVPVDVKVLSVSASVDPPKAKVGQLVQFTANPDGAGSGWTYQWDFGDERSSPKTTKLTAAHTYQNAGTYFARVTARHGADGGVSPLQIVQVDAVKPTDGGNQQAQPGSGAVGTGTGSGPKKGVTSGPKQSDKTHSSAGGDRGGSAGPSGAGGSGGGSGNGSTGTGASAESSGSRTGGFANSGGEHPARSPHGGEIEGVLLADAGAVDGADLARAQSQETARRAQQAARSGRGSPGGWPAWVGGGVLLAVLLATGVALELVPRTGPELVYA